MKYVSFFPQITLKDKARFGGKNASLGQMINDLAQKGITVPAGFATTTEAFWAHLGHNNLLPQLKELRASIEDESDLARLQEVSYQMRQLIVGVPFPEEIKADILAAYKELSLLYSQSELCDVAVRSSATAEDLPDASFAGQHESFLHIYGENELLDACLHCMASLFTDRAIVYRKSNGIDDFSVALSVGVQKMVRSDKASAGVLFTLDPESGHPGVITITSSYGLGELVVKGVVNPDEFVVHKPTLAKGFKPLIRKLLGGKTQRLVYREKEESAFSWLYKTVGITPTALGSGVASAYDAAHPIGAVVKIEEVPEVERRHFSLSDNEVFQLASMALTLEEHYSQLNGKWTPLDIEWAKDGVDGKLYIVQARPETVHSRVSKEQRLITFAFTKGVPEDKPLLEGQAIGYGIVAGRVQVLASLGEADAFNEGDILVTSMTDPDWVPLIKKASALITDRGGRTCHAAIVSRELGVPALIGTTNASMVLKTGQEVTVDCSGGSQGAVYAGMRPFERKEFLLKELPTPPVQLLLNIADPLKAFSFSLLPSDGVGLARLEFIIASMIGVHPLASLYPDRLLDKKVCDAIKQLLGPTDWAEHYKDLLAEAVGSMVAAFYPRSVVVRTSDFKSNEYRQLLGGSFFEPHEENPLMGLRGAARYISPLYGPAFELECRALVKVREQFGLKNMAILIPFVRSLSEAKQVNELLERYGLKPGEGDLRVLMMVEVPENIVMLEDYAAFFDGFSIGSNDLTQFILGVDRDSAEIGHLYDERAASVKNMLALAIEKAKRAGRPISICGQGPSDYPDLADFLIEAGITSLSLVPDALLPFLLRKK